MYSYPYKLLFDDYIENIPTYKKIWEVSKFIVEYKPDIVNVNGWGIDGSITFSIILSFILRKKIVISNESTFNDRKRIFIKEYLKKILAKLADGFIVFGKSSEDYILKLGGGKSKIIENKAAIVDDEEILKIFLENKKIPFKKTEITTDKNFIFVGRLIDVKNLPFFISVFQKIKSEKKTDWGLIIVGNGSEQEKITNIVKHQPDDIFLFDAVDWQTVPKFFTRANCLVLPSYSETWGLVVNEAMICGLSIIVSDQVGCKDDLIDGNGYVFESNNAESLEKAMIKMSNNNFELEFMKEKSKLLIYPFKVKNVANRIVEEFKRLF